MMQMQFARIINGKIKGRLKQTSLKNILLWLFIPVFIICIAANFFLTNILVRRQIKENALVSITELVSQAKHHLDYRLYTVFEQMVLFEQSPDMAALITHNGGEDEIYHHQYFVRIFNSIERIYFSFYSVLDTVFVAVQQGMGPVNIFYKSDYPPAKSSFSFSMEMNGAPLITQGEKSYQWFNLHRNEINPNIYTDNRLASLYKVLGSENSEGRAFFLFNFKNSFFRQILEETKIVRSGYLALIGDGAVMQFNKAGSAPYEIPLLVLETVENDPRGAGNISYRGPGGLKMLIVWESLQLSRWKLAAIFPEKDLMRSVDNIQLITFICSLLALCFAMVLSFLVIRVISDPIKKWAGKISGMDETSNVLLDDVICAEIVELNRGISSLMDRVHRLSDDKLIEEGKKRELEMRILQERINPHFLYNALYSVLQLSRLGEYEKMTRIIMSLNGFYRLSLSKGRDIIELKDEIAHAEYYLGIQMIHNKKIFYAVDVDSELMGMKIVKLVLQPILENAVTHGVRHGEDLHLRIYARKNGNDIKISVIDDGIGIIQEKAGVLRQAFRSNDWSDLPEVYGLRNVHERIRLHYGVPYGLDIESIFEQGTEVSILVPTEKA